MRRPSLKKIIIFIVFLSGTLLFVRNIFRENQRILITNEILTALRSRSTPEQVKVNINTTIINIEHCKPYANQDFLLAVVVVTSIPEEAQDRHYLRANWYRWSGKFRMVKLVFFVGLPKNNDFDNIRVESFLYGDIIMESMKESYFSLTLKTLRILKWFLSSCSNVKYLIKSDMDTFIHLPNMINYLNSIEQKGSDISNNFIGGEIAIINNHQINDPFSKTYMPSEILKAVHLVEGSTYPNYTLGGFYVLSSALIQSLFIQSLKVPLIQYEDMFLTGIVGNRDLGINLTSIPYVYHSFFNHPILYLNTSYDNFIIATHFEKQDKDIMTKYFKYYQSNYKNHLKIINKKNQINNFHI